MKKTIFLLGIFTLLACEDVDKTIADNLQSTTWKLIGLVDTQTGELKVLEPKDCKNCYTITFETDSSGFGYSSTNRMYVTLKKIPSLGIMTYINELGDGSLFIDVLRFVNSYSVEKNELKFFYKRENKQYYLQYKLIEP